MKIEELKLLAALFREPHLTQVAEQFHLSQSNLSKIIKRIETELGFKLFERKGFQGLKPTPQGLLLAGRLGKFSRSWDDMLFLVKNYDQQRLDLKVTGPSLYMKNIFMRRWFESPLTENFRLFYVQSRMDEISATAHSSDLDLVVTSTPTEFADWVPIPIFVEKFAVFSSAKKSPATLEELVMQDRQWLGYIASSGLLELFFQHYRIPIRDITAYIDDVESTLDVLTENPRLLALLPAHAANPYRKLRTWEVPISMGQNLGQTLYLMYRRGSEAAEAAVKPLRKILDVK